MPQKQAAKKSLRQDIKRAVRSKKIKTELKVTLKKSRQLIDAKKDGTKEKVATSIKLLDKAAQKGIIKKSTAARKKSRLMKHMHSVGATTKQSAENKKS